MMRPDPELPQSVPAPLRLATSPVTPTEPCDAEGPDVLAVASELRLPRHVIEAMVIRADAGRLKYKGRGLARPWPPGTVNAWEELLDALGYLLSSGDPDDELFAIRLAGQTDAWARRRGLYTADLGR